MRTGSRFSIPETRVFEMLNSRVDGIKVSMIWQVMYVRFCACLKSLFSPVSSSVELRVYLLLHHPPRRRSNKKLFVDAVSETVWNTTWKTEQTPRHDDWCTTERILWGRQSLYKELDLHSLKEIQMLARQHKNVKITVWKVMWDIYIYIYEWEKER